MKQFFKFTLATILGVFIASIISMLLFFGIIGAIASSSEKVTTIEDNTIYQIDLKGVLVDRSQDDPFSAAIAEAMGQKSQAVIGLDDVLANIKKAKQTKT